MSSNLSCQRRITRLPSTSTAMMAAWAVVVVVLMVPGADAGVCPSYIPPFIGAFFDAESGAAQVWTLSPTFATPDAPPGGSACPSAAYVAQFDPNSGNCMSAWSHAGLATPTDSGCVYTFKSDATTYTIIMGCGSGAVSYDAAVTVTHSDYHHHTSYNFTGQAGAVCGATFSLLQTTCSDSACSSGCSTETIPQGQCLTASQGGQSVSLQCNSGSLLTSEVFPDSTSCAGASTTTTSPTNTCFATDNSAYVAWQCLQPNELH